MKRLSQWWRKPVVYRTAIGAYVVLVLGLAAISFAVSNRDVRGGIYLRGHAEMETGRTNGMRGVFHYAPTGEALRPAEMDWMLVGEKFGRVPVLFDDATALELWPDLRVRLPEGLGEGSYTLAVRTSHDKVPEVSFTAPVTVSQRPQPADSLTELDWPEQGLRDEETHRRRPRVEALPDAPDSSLAVSPPDGELVRGLPGRVFFRVFDEESGEPLPATLNIEVVQGLFEAEISSTVHTDSLGFASLNVFPATDLELLVTVETVASTLESKDPDSSEPDLPEDLDILDALEGPPGPDQFTIRLSAVASQFGVRPHARIVTPEDPIEATILSILGDCTYMVDLYDGSRLLETLTLAMEDGAGGARFHTPSTSEASPLLRLQAYQSLYGSDRGWDAAHLLLVEDDSQAGLLEATRDLFSWLGARDGLHHYATIAEGDYLDETLSERQLRRLIEAGLEDVPRTFELPPILMNSRQGDREDLELWKTETRGELQILLGLVLFGGIVVVLYFVLLGIRRHQKEAQLLADVDLELADPGSDPDELRAIQLERITVALQGAIVLITILAFALGILLVVSYL